MIFEWDQLAELKARGLRILSVEKRPGAETDLIVEPGSIPGLSQAPKPSRLAIRLAELHRQAWRSPGRHTITLPNGLRIDLKIEPAETHLLIARTGVSPSPVEWRTVLEHFPYKVDPAPAAEPAEAGDWRALRAAWKTPEVFKPKP